MYTVTLTVDDGTALDDLIYTLRGPDSRVGTYVTDTIKITFASERG